MKHKKTVLGITGPIACGKNEVCRILQRGGAFIIDADIVGHDVIKQRTIKNKLLLIFGDKILDKKGQIDRKSLGSIVFSNKRHLLHLNRITHPSIFDEVARKIRRTKRRFIVINAAVLKEIGLTKFCDQIWLVSSSRANRIERLLSKGLTRKEALIRISSQRTIASYKKEADVVIENDGSKSDLKAKIKKMWSPDTKVSAPWRSKPEPNL